MGLRTKIKWTDHSWNPWTGCHKKSAGCKNCYMFDEQRRWGRDPNVVHRCSPSTFNLPLKIKKPAQIFTCSWSDFFVAEADPWRSEAWDIIRRCHYLTFQILTKRPERIKDNLPKDWGDGWPNVWLGVTIESSAYLNRINILQSIPATLRFISAEPLLDNIVPDDGYDARVKFSPVDWIICGCESGRNSRPTDINWVRKLRDFSKQMDIPFFLKQLMDRNGKIIAMPELDGVVWAQKPTKMSKVS